MSWLLTLNWLQFFVLVYTFIAWRGAHRRRIREGILLALHVADRPISSVVFFWRYNSFAIYSVLRELEDDGLVRSFNGGSIEELARRQGHPRRLYELVAPPSTPS